MTSVASDRNNEIPNSYHIDHPPTHAFFLLLHHRHLPFAAHCKGIMMIISTETPAILLRDYDRATVRLCRKSAAELQHRRQSVVCLVIVKYTYSFSHYCSLFPTTSYASQ